MKKFIVILILMFTILLSILIIPNSYTHKIVNIPDRYEIVDDHIENNNTQTFGG